MPAIYDYSVVFMMGMPAILDYGEGGLSGRLGEINTCK